MALQCRSTTLSKRICSLASGYLTGKKPAAAPPFNSAIWHDIDAHRCSKDIYSPLDGMVLSSLIDLGIYSLFGRPYRIVDYLLLAGLVWEKNTVPSWKFTIVYEQANRLLVPNFIQFGSFFKENLRLAPGRRKLIFGPWDRRQNSWRHGNTSRHHRSWLRGAWPCQSSSLVLMNWWNLKC